MRSVVGKFRGLQFRLDGGEQWACPQCHPWHHISLPPPLPLRLHPLPPMLSFLPAAISRIPPSVQRHTTVWNSGESSWSIYTRKIGVIPLPGWICRVDPLGLGRGSASTCIPQFWVPTILIVPQYWSVGTLHRHASNFLGLTLQLHSTVEFGSVPGPQVSRAYQRVRMLSLSSTPIQRRLASSIPNRGSAPAPTFKN